MKKARPGLKTRVERNTSYEKDMAAAFNVIFQNIVRIEKGKHSRLPELQGHPGGFEESQRTHGEANDFTLH